jgi:hypothetical protein
MSKIDKLAPPGYYVQIITSPMGVDIADSIEYVSPTGMCSYVRALFAKENKPSEWTRLFWTCAPRKNWATVKKDGIISTVYERFETYKDAKFRLDLENAQKLTKSDCPDNLR